MKTNKIKMTKEKQKSEISIFQQILERLLVYGVSTSLLAVAFVLGIFYLAFTGRLDNININWASTKKAVAQRETASAINHQGNHRDNELAKKNDTTILTKSFGAAEAVTAMATEKETERETGSLVQTSETLPTVASEFPPIAGGETRLAPVENRYKVTGQVRLDIFDPFVETLEVKSVNLSVVKREKSIVFIDSLDLEGKSSALDGMVRVMLDAGNVSMGDISNGQLSLNLWLNVQIPGYGVFTSLPYTLSGQMASESLAESNFSGISNVLLSDAYGNIVGKVSEIVLVFHNVYGVSQKNTYAVETGDSLWKIAEKHYGSGFAYQNLIAYNKNVYPSISEKVVLPGWVLIVSETYSATVPVETEKSGTGITPMTVSPTFTTAVPVATPTAVTTSTVFFGETLTWILILCGVVAFVALVVLIIHILRAPPVSGVELSKDESKDEKIFEAQEIKPGDTNVDEKEKAKEIEIPPWNPPPSTA